jgi:uncharacterized membrane protein YsdA (DUF1294 family)
MRGVSKLTSPISIYKDDMPNDTQTSFAIYLVAINIIAFAAFWLDKRWARQGTSRVPERTLLTLALAGGTIGALAGQKALRHKTRKQPFRAWLLAIAGFQVLASIAGIKWFAFGL